MKYRWSLAAFVLSAGCAAAENAMPPHVNDAGKIEYRTYLGASDHRAFAIAPGGAWGWKVDAGVAEEAELAALAACQENTRQKCVLFDVDGKPVFDAEKWTHLWGPYAGDAEARQVSVGRQVGERFPDIVYTDQTGRQLKVSGLHGKVALLHFWGSWCGPCRREMPDMQRLYESLKGRPDVAFTLLQVREKFAVSKHWADAQGIRLPLYDSGSTGETDAIIRLADGTTMGDRVIAASFPTTYVIDKRGVVVFSHTGPVPAWGEYRDFLLDAAKRSGR